MKFLKVMFFGLFVSLFMSSCGIIDSSDDLKSAGDSVSEESETAESPSLPDDFSPESLSHVILFEGEEPKCYISLKGHPEFLPDFVKSEMSMEEYNQLVNQSPDDSPPIPDLEVCDALQEAELSANTSNMVLHDDSATELASVAVVNMAVGTVMTAGSCVAGIFAGYSGAYKIIYAFSGAVASLIGSSAAFTVFSEVADDFAKQQEATRLSKSMKPVVGALVFNTIFCTGLGYTFYLGTHESSEK